MRACLPRARFLVGAALLVGACGRSSAERTESAAAPVTEASCAAQPFAASTSLPEASGAVEVPTEAGPALFVVADSGNHGAYVLLDPTTGSQLEAGALDLGGDRDADLEGATWAGGALHVISSSGWVRAYHRVAHGWQLVDGPYAIGPVDPAFKTSGGLGDTPATGSGMACSRDGVNCGRNYEGVCALDPERAPAAPAALGPACAGFALSKADGTAYCFAWDAQHRMVVDRTRGISIARPGTPSDCGFDSHGRLWVQANMFDLGSLYAVDGWQPLAAATLDGSAPAVVTRIARITIGFPEAMAPLASDDLVVFSDTGGAPSLAAKVRCRPPRQ